MRVAFFLNEFPVVSETFILNQITGLLDRGVDVEIFARQLHRSGAQHDDVGRYGLLARAHELGTPQVGPPSGLGRLLGRAQELKTWGLAPLSFRRLRALSPLAHGFEALSLKMLHRVATLARLRPYDIVHCQFGPNGVLAAQLRALDAFRAPIVTHFRGYDASSYVSTSGAGVYRELFAQGDLFLSVSRDIQERIIGLGAPRVRCLVHHSGVRTVNIPFVSRSPSGSPQLLSTGRMVQKKGLEYGLRAVALLKAKFPTLLYTIIGDGPLASALQRLTQELALERNVTFTGALTAGEVSRHMQRADVLLVPSVRAQDGDVEGIPNVIMEAFASGLPVVGTNHGGIPEIIRDGVTGSLVPEHDAPALAAAVATLVEQVALREQLTAAARRHVEQEHDAARLTDLLIERYQGLLRDQGP